jgi:hypothetical protein
MSWASSQNYPTAQTLSNSFGAVNAIAINTPTTLYTTSVLPEGVWLIMVNGVTIPSSTNALNSTILTLNQISSSGTVAIAQVNLLGDFVVFPTLSTAIKGGAGYTYSIVVNASSATAGTTYNVGADSNEIVLVRLTNTSV